MLLGFVACAPEPVTVQGAETSSLYDLFARIAIVIFVIVAGLIGWSILAYRARPGDDSLPVQFRHNRGLEILWFAIPQVLVIALFLASTSTQNVVDERHPEPAVTVEVTAFQWGWRFDYGDGAVVEGTSQDPAEVMLPVGRPVAFLLRSADVVHSFYVPRFMTKRDMIPGETERIDVTITEAGIYRGACAEFCGLQHDQMLFEVHAVDGTDFDDWYEEVSDGD